MSSLRSKVLSCYRSLHRTRLKVFRDDSFALEAGKQRIRTEFLKHKNETDPAKIAELIQMAEGAEKVLRCNIVQGIQTDNGTFRLRITEDTELQNNAPRPCKKKKVKVLMDTLACRVGINQYEVGITS